MTITIPDFWIGVIVGALAMFALMMTLAVTYGRRKRSEA